MSLDLEKKFRTTGLDAADCPLLLRQIEEVDDYGKLISLIYMYGYSCNEHPKILKLCQHYINKQVPGLTAVCMKVLIDYWGKWKPNLKIIEHFLDIALFEDWYDEVIFAASFVYRNRGQQFPPAVLDKFCTIKDHPELRGLFSSKTQREVGGRDS